MKVLLWLGGTVGVLAVIALAVLWVALQGATLG